MSEHTHDTSKDVTNDAAGTERGTNTLSLPLKFGALSCTMVALTVVMPRTAKYASGALAMLALAACLVLLVAEEVRERRAERGADRNSRRSRPSAPPLSAPEDAL